jgi:gamma-glutamyltranspeptidase
MQQARGRQAAVVSGHQLATQSALKVLKGGGNVVDAAIAGCAVLAVALPHACTLGGDCFALISIEGKLYGLNASGMSPAALPQNATAEQLARGPLSCSVPGVVGGWEAMHNRFGKKPWRDLMAPAVSYAREGIVASSEFIAATREFLPQLRTDTGSNALFLDSSNQRKEGDILKQAALAETLERVAADGANAVYEGPIGKSLCETVARLGGVLSPSDLKSYQPLWVEPLQYTYAGHTVRVMPPNSYGIAMLLQLAALDGSGLKSTTMGSIERLRLLMKAAEVAFRSAKPLLADPRVAIDALPSAFSDSALKELRSGLQRSSVPITDAPKSHGTAVISVADDQGNGVTVVQSIFAPFGSIVADAHTGIVMNNRLLGFTNVTGHPNAPAPSKRPAHTLNPAMAFKDGRLRFCLGTPGGSGQTITLTQVLTNMLDFGLDLASSIAELRWSMDLRGNFTLEHEMDASLPDKLAAVGISARVAARDQRYFFGSAECISIEPSGDLLAVADHRREAFAGAI